MTTELLPPPSPTVPPAGPPSAPLPTPSGRGPGRAVAIGLLGTAAAVTVAWGTITLADLAAYSETTSTSTADVVDTVRIDTDGTIQVTAGPVTAIQIVRTVDSGLREPTFGTSEISTATGTALELTGDCPELVSVRCSVDYALVVPADTRLDLRSDAGSIVIEGVGGDVQAYTSAGAITALDTSGTLDLRSDAGRVFGDALRSGIVTARSDAGSIRLSFDAAPEQVDAETSAGRVEVAVPDDGTTYAVTASTSAGSTNIDIATDPASTRTIRASSDAGSVTLRYPS